ncbi:hypothetical protein GUJ93_ZPchr0004g39344 [Zizania palustris]|uniref:Uncharacterized protein n=1 Tax=Zizania palustris TaxID=103762 RepID=A0A8J5SGF8_ZIZPA|nr:hypothetical protein GUJ93_ZPchr0004g39344 [Zizania palustris]
MQGSTNRIGSGRARKGTKTKIWVVNALTGTRSIKKDQHGHSSGFNIIGLFIMTINNKTDLPMVDCFGCSARRPTRGTIGALPAFLPVCAPLPCYRQCATAAPQGADYCGTIRPSLITPPLSVHCCHPTDRPTPTVMASGVMARAPIGHYPLTCARVPPLPIKGGKLVNSKLEKGLG